ncbi:MAG: glycosyltransferase family 2 protein [Chitinophagaceae bacterium]
MNPAETKITIIIPTHNRAPSTKRLLDKLALQTYPKELMEVIAVANSCEDNTVEMLRSYHALYAFQYAETSGAGPAVPRNKGASMAKGDILIFLDDDVDPSEGLAEAHVRAHEDDRSVVIGYLPLSMPERAGYFRKNLKMWWENKFQQMRKQGYRYNYEDLISGNFSISAKLFNEVDGFITTLRCRDDYELGIRLLNSNANFKLSMEAHGLHCDEVTDFERSLKRKREEGRTDVKLWRTHPATTNSLQNEYREKKFGFPESKKAYFLIHWPRLTDMYAKLVKGQLKIMERWGLRGKWSRASYRLLTYWYYRGLMDELKTQESLLRYFSHEPDESGIKKTDINLENGLKAAEAILDEERPHAATIFYGHEKIGTIPFKPGTERLKGVHLRRILATTFSKSLMKTLALKKLSQKTGAIS